jgi:hypothetical protein
MLAAFLLWCAHQTVGAHSCRDLYALQYHVTIKDLLNLLLLLLLQG